MDLISAYSGILKLFLLFAAGFIMHQTGMVSEDSRTFMSRCITNVAAPALLFGNAINYISLELFTSSPITLVLPMIVSCLSIGIALCFNKIFKMNASGVFYTLFTYSNSIAAGLPICMAMFGEVSVPYIIIYYLCNTLGFWIIGSYFISKDSDHPIKFGLPMLKNIFSPPLLGFFSGCIIKLTGISLPSPVFDAIEELGGLTTPLSGLYVGAFIGLVGFKRIFNIDKEGLFVIIGRFVVSPLLMLGLGMLFNLPPLAITVLVIMAAMPIMNFAVILASRYNGNTALAVQMLTTTSVLMMGFVPIYLTICNILLY